MYKLYYIIVGIFFLSISIGQANSKKTIDSIGIENSNGKKIILHRVEVKETYYAIARKYNVSHKDVMEYNDSKALQIGITIKVPTNLAFNTSAQPNTKLTAQITYTIKPKDNLNMLAEKYGTSVEEIKQLNNLNSINLQIGQVLKIPTTTNSKPETTPTVVPNITTPTPSNTPTLEGASTHTVKAKESLNIIAKLYQTTAEEIKKLNGLSTNNLQIGQVLKVAPSTANADVVVEKPVTPSPKTYQKPVEEKAVQNNAPKTNDIGFEHTVLAGETIYAIAKKYGLTTYQIKMLNNLTSDEVTVGQKLNIKGVAADNASEADEVEASASTKSIKDPKLKYAASRYGLSQFEEKGAAVSIDDPDLDASKMLVLHRTAPIGTVIKVTNPMTNRSTFAKVVGKFTENETTKDVIIVMTKAVAEAVGALDKRFFCNINYGAQENEQ